VRGAAVGPNRAPFAVSLHEIADTLSFAIFTGQVPAPAAV
jgi:hypothetical protein